MLVNGLDYLIAHITEDAGAVVVAGPDCLTDQAINFLLPCVDDDHKRRVGRVFDAVLGLEVALEVFATKNSLTPPRSRRLLPYGYNLWNIAGIEIKCLIIERLRGGGSLLHRVIDGLRRSLPRACQRLQVIRQSRHLPLLTRRQCRDNDCAASAWRLRYPLNKSLHVLPARVGSGRNTGAGAI